MDEVAIDTPQESSDDQQQDYLTHQQDINIQPGTLLSKATCDEDPYSTTSLLRSDFVSIRSYHNNRVTNEMLSERDNKDY